MTNQPHRRLAPTRPPTETELDQLYAAIGTTRQAAHTRAAQRAHQPPPRTRRTRS